MPVEIDADGVFCPAPPKATFQNAANSKAIPLPNPYQDATRNSYSTLLPNAFQNATKNSNPARENVNPSLLPNPSYQYAARYGISAMGKGNPILPPNTFQNTPNSGRSTILPQECQDITKVSQNPATPSKVDPLNLDGLSKEEISRILLDFLKSLPGASNAGLGWQ